jgi:uncharacterized membrane protein YjgN (DUF898 family)
MQQSTGRPFVFTATGSAYFRIWIVNLLLSIVTLGFYSPWAKVRRLRYFYGNTLFDSSPFEFHGRPIALLKGRLIGLVLLIAYTQAAKISFTLWVGVVVVLIALFPWLLWKSFRFRMANSSYRGIRFGFDGTVRDAYLTFVPLMLMFVAPAATLFYGERSGAPLQKLPVAYSLSVLVVLVVAPWFYFRLRAYQHRHARLGATPFAFDGRVRSAYWIAFKIFLLGIGFLLIASAAGGAVGGGLFLVTRNSLDSQVVTYFAGGAGVAAAYLVLLSAGSQAIAMIQNYVWNHSTLGGARFTSNVSRSRLWWIQFGNIFLTLITLGFFWPFAVVRSTRYRIEQLAWEGDSGAMVAGEGDTKVGAVGDESADLFGLDIAL